MVNVALLKDTEQSLKLEKTPSVHVQCCTIISYSKSVFNS